MDTTALDTRNASDQPVKQAGTGSHAKKSMRVKLRTLADIDQRTLAHKQARRLLDQITADLGGDLTDAQQQLAQHASCDDRI